MTGSGRMVPAIGTYRAVEAASLVNFLMDALE